MADSVDSVTLLDDTRRIVRKFTNVSDGTGESGVVKVDVSTFTAPNGIDALTTVAVEEIWWTSTFASLRLFYDAATDDEIAMLGSGGRLDLRRIGGIPDPRSTTPVGDIKLTTGGGASGAVYTLILVCRKVAPA